MKNLSKNYNYNSDDYWNFLQEWLEELTIYDKEQLNSIIDDMKAKICSQLKKVDFSVPIDTKNSFNIRVPLALTFLGAYDENLVL